MKQDRRGSRGGRVGLALGLALWVLTPLALAAHLYMRSNDVQVVDREQVWTVPEPSQQEIKARVGLALTWATPPVAVAPAWDGIVQGVRASAGTRLVSGDVFVKVQGVDRILATTPEPFIRSLSLGMRGADVESLNQLLRTRNLSHGTGDVFSRSTQNGVRGLAESLGAGSDVRIFDPSWVIFLPRDQTVKELSINVGAPAPGAGTPLLVPAEELASAKIIDAGIAESLAQGDDLPLPPADSLPEGTDVLVSGEPLRLNDERNAVDAGSLAALNSVLAPGGKAAVIESRSSNGATGWSVPSVALYIDRAGLSCILVKRDGEIVGLGAAVASVQGSRSVVQAPLRSTDKIGMDPTIDPMSCS